MKNQYLTLLIFAVILSGALILSWHAYEDIQSQETQNRKNFITNAKSMSQLFENNIVLWQEKVKNKKITDMTVSQSLKQGDVAISSGKPLWPYGDFLTEAELSVFINRKNNNSTLDIPRTQRRFNKTMSADPFVIRLYLKKKPQGHKKIENIEHLISLAEQAELSSQKDKLDLNNRTWTFKMQTEYEDHMEALQIWRSVIMPDELFTFDKSQTEYMSWSSKDPGINNRIEARQFQGTSYYWALTKEGRKQIQQPAGKQGLYLSLIVSAFVLFYGVFFFLRSNSQLSDQAEQREQLVADISHELRTPVTTLRLYSEMLLDGRIKSDDDKQRYLKNMVRESNRLSRLINNVLDFSRLSRGKLKLNIMNISLQLFGEDLKYIIEGLDKEKRVSIHLEHDVDFLGDLDDTMQVIYNLINNAIKYAKNSPIDVSSEIQSDDKLKIIVQDQGEGIANELKDSLFEPFTRGKDVHKDQIKGSGLGLSVSRSLMTTMEGELLLENSEKGARFVAIFKLAK